MNKARLAVAPVWMFPGKSIAEAYALARACGFTAIEHSFPYDNSANATARMLRDNGLELAEMYALPTLTDTLKGIACIPGREEEFRRGVATGLEYAHTVGCGMLGVLAGAIPQEVARGACMEVLGENLALAGDMARGSGVTILVEPICGYRIPTFSLKTTGETVAMLREVGSDNVRVCFDTFHTAMEEGSLLQTLDLYLDFIAYVQICNVPGRNGPGDGELDLPYFVDRLLERGWKSWISCEYTALQPAGKGLLSWAEPFLRAGRLSA